MIPWPIHKNDFFSRRFLATFGILFVISLVVFGGMRYGLSFMRDARRIRDIKKISQALERYFEDHRAYPVSFWASSGDEAWKDSSIDLALALSPYLPELPRDPINQAGSAHSGRYAYSYYANGYGGSGKWYMLVFRLENPLRGTNIPDGVAACDKTFFRYGTPDEGILTTGKDCVL